MNHFQFFLKKKQLLFCITASAETGSLDHASDQTKNFNSLCGRHIRHRKKRWPGKHLQSNQRLWWHHNLNIIGIKQQTTILNVIITRTDTGNLEKRVYREMNHTQKILNYSSNNERAHKTNYVQTLFRKARTNRNTLVVRKNEEQLKTIFHKNG